MEIVINSKRRILHPERLTDEGKIASGIRCGQWLYISGQGPLDMQTMQYIPGTIEEETDLTLVHIDKIIAAAGGTRADIVKCTCYLSDLADFGGFHAAFTSFFKQNLPCRTTSQAGLLRGIRVGIDAVAFLE